MQATQWILVVNISNFVVCNPFCIVQMARLEFFYMVELECLWNKKNTSNIVNIRGRDDDIFYFWKFQFDWIWTVYLLSWLNMRNQSKNQNKQRIRNKNHKIAIEPIQNIFWMCNEWRWLCSHGDYPTQFEFLQTINTRTHAQHAVPKVICSA